MRTLAPRLRLSASLALLGLALLGCSGSDMGINDSLYVETMADLQRLSRERGDSATQAQRDSILSEKGLTPEELEQAARWLSRHPDVAATLWRQVDRQSRLPRQ